MSDTMGASGEADMVTCDSFVPHRIFTHKRLRILLSCPGIESGQRRVKKERRIEVGDCSDQTVRLGNDIRERCSSAIQLASFHRAIMNEGA